MTRKLAISWIGLALLLPSLSGAGCHKKEKTFTCKDFAAKAKKCSKELKAVIIRDAVAKAKEEYSKLPPDERKKKIETARKSAEGMANFVISMVSSDEFKKKCKAKKTSAKDKAQFARIKECSQKRSCQAFADCLAKKL